MKRLPRRTGLLLVTLLAVAPLAADFQTALEAYEAGDFETAYREWLPLADGDSAAAQFNLGLLFDRGEGRAQDHEQAAEWYSRAAENGFVRAQFRLGEMFEAGQGVEQDLVQARKWFAIAAEERYAGAKKRMKRVAKEMTAHEISLGDMWAREHIKARKKKR